MNTSRVEPQNEQVDDTHGGGQETRGLYEFYGTTSNSISTATDVVMKP